MKRSEWIKGQSSRLTWKPPFIIEVLPPECDMWKEWIDTKMVVMDVSEKDFLCTTSAGSAMRIPIKHCRRVPHLDAMAQEILDDIIKTRAERDESIKELFSDTSSLMKEIMGHVNE